MKTIFITLSRGSLIRNFLKTGFVAKLADRDIRIVILSPNYEDKNIFDEYRGNNIYFEPLIRTSLTKIDNILMEFARGVIYSKTVLARYRYKYTGLPPIKILYYPRRVFFYFFRFFPGIKAIIRGLHLLFFPQTEHDYLFKKYKPDLVFITDYMNIADVGVCKGAQRHNVTTVGMTKSWDNFSKSLFRIKSDKLFVWGEHCKKQAIKFQGYKNDDVIITGGLQFDYYVKENVIDRSEFCKSLGLDKDKRIIFYGSTGGRCQHEHEYIDLLLDFIEKNGIEAQILIRPHLAYKNDDEKFQKYQDVKNVVIYKNRQNLKLKDRWDLSDDHLKYLFNSIYYSDVCINIASTLTLDSVAIGTPVININFDPTNKDDDNSVSRFYLTDYTGSVAGFGGSWLVRSHEEFLKALKNILIKKENKKNMMDRMRAYFLYRVDGNTADRLLKNILEILESN